MQHQSKMIIPLFQRFSKDNIFPRETAQGKKATLGGTFDRHTNFQGKGVLLPIYIDKTI